MKMKLKELRDLIDGGEGWNEVAEKKKSRNRLIILLKSLMQADLNLDRNLSWEEFLLYEAEKRRKRVNSQREILIRE